MVVMRGLRGGVQSLLGGWFGEGPRRLAGGYVGSNVGQRGRGALARGDNG